MNKYSNTNNSTYWIWELEGISQILIKVKCYWRWIKCISSHELHSWYYYCCHSLHKGTRFSNLSKFTQLVSRGLEIQTQICLTAKLRSLIFFTVYEDPSYLTFFCNPNYSIKNRTRELHQISKPPLSLTAQWHQVLSYVGCTQLVTERVNTKTQGFRQTHTQCFSAAQKINAYQ